MTQYRIIRKWNELENNFLIENKDMPIAQIASILMRSANSIKARKRYLNLTVKKSARIWSSDEDEYLTQMYSVMPEKHFILKFNVTRFDLMYRVKLLNLRKRKFYIKDNLNLEKLLDDSKESYYWIGFLLADAHFKNNSCQLKISATDTNHLEKLGKYLGKVRPITIYENKSNKIKFIRGIQIKPTKRIATFIMTGDAMIKIIDKFFITNNKTYNPPNIKNYNLSPTQFISMLIGFIDGDGSIKYHHNTVDCKVECHASWQSNLLYFYETLKEISGITSKHIPKLNSRGYFYINLNFSLVLFLRNFIIENGLPAMGRKWEKVKNIPKKINHNAKLPIEIIKAIRRDYIPNCRGYGSTTLAKLYGIDSSTIKKIINNIHYTLPEYYD
jgi:hypothetical protein